MSTENCVNMYILVAVVSNDRSKMTRNQAFRLGKTLRKCFYGAIVKHLQHSDSRNWWRQMKRFTGQCNHCDLAGLTNTVANDDANVLADMINESLKRASDDLQPLCDISIPNSFVIPDQYTPESVLAKLERIEVRKAPEPDGLPNWVLKEFLPFLCEPLCAILNASVQEGSMPLMWKQTNVLSVPKSNLSTSIESDLRPILLTPTVSKVLESFVGSWINRLIISATTISLVHVKVAPQLAYWWIYYTSGIKQLMMAIPFTYIR